MGEGGGSVKESMVIRVCGVDATVRLGGLESIVRVWVRGASSGFDLSWIFRYGAGLTHLSVLVGPRRVVWLAGVSWA